MHICAQIKGSPCFIPIRSLERYTTGAGSKSVFKSFLTILTIERFVQEPEEGVRPRMSVTKKAAFAANRNGGEGLSQGLYPESFGTGWFMEGKWRWSIGYVTLNK